MANFNMTFGSDQHFNFGFTGNQNFGAGMDNSANPDLAILRNSIANDGIGYIAGDNTVLSVWSDDVVVLCNGHASDFAVEYSRGTYEGGNYTGFYLQFYDPGDLQFNETWSLTINGTIYEGEVTTAPWGGLDPYIQFSYDEEYDWYFGIGYDGGGGWYYVVVPDDYGEDPTIKIERTSCPHKIDNKFISRDPILQDAIEHYGIGYTTGGYNHRISSDFMPYVLEKYATFSPDQSILHYASSTTSASTMPKVVSNDDLPTSVTSGFALRILFTKGNTSTSTFTININSAGAKTVYLGTDTLTNFTFPAYTVLDFVYYNNYWRLVGGVKATTSNTGIVKLSTSTSSTSTTEAATPSAVKSAYDRGDSAYTLAGNAIPKTDISTSVSSASTNSQVPSSKLFYDTVGDVESILEALL